MSTEKTQSGGTISCGCGCFGCLTAVVSLILLCYLFNCGWAKNIVLRCIREVSAAWHSGAQQQGENNASQAKSLQ